MTLCLVDTNVLLRYADHTDPRYSTVRHAVTELRENYTLLTSSQNLVEFWNVMTRPTDRNGFGKTISAARPLLDLVELLFPRLEDPPGAYSLWRELVVRFGVSGVQVHDARLVAVMTASDVRHILTFDVRDFQRYLKIGIQAISPAEI